MKSFIVTALLLTSAYASAQGMGSGSVSSAGSTTPSSTLGTGASTGVNPATGTSETPASGSVIDRSMTPASGTSMNRQKQEDANLNPSSRDANMREGRKMESKDSMIKP